MPQPNDLSRSLVALDQDRGHLAQADQALRPVPPARYGAATPGSRLERAAGLLAMRLARDRYGPTGVEQWSLVIKHDDGRRSIGGDFRNVPTIREIATQAQFASGRKGESGFAIRCPDDTSPTAFRISVGVVKALRSQ